MKHKMIHPIIITVFLALSLNAYGQDELPEIPEAPPILSAYGQDISKEDEARILERLPKRWSLFRL